MQQADAVIIGGGMVGSATALGLALRGLNVVLLENRPPKPFEAQQPPDLRVSAINLRSQALLSELGVWDGIQAMRVHPYRKISVWETTGKCAFSADQLKLPELGYFVENRLIQLSVLEFVEQFPNCQIVYGQSVESIDWGTTQIVYLNSTTQVECDWVIAADGANSQTRALANIGTRGWQYQQQVLGVTVKMHNEVGDESWQQFIPSGPMALLPMYDNHASLIWYNSHSAIAELKALDNDALKHRIVESFPDNLGDFTVLAKASFPIQRCHAKHYFKNNCLLIGDAAHAINPLAGQGVNLGFKDLAVLLEMIDNNPQGVETEQGRKQIFKHYERKRRYDNLLMMSAMDAFYYTFSNSILPIKLLRNASLALANKGGPLKNLALQYAVGGFE